MKDKKEEKKSAAAENETPNSETPVTTNKAKEYEELWDNHLRLQAEFDNYKKRSYKEKMEFVKFANESLILELLEILDNFERGIKSAEAKKDFDLLHQGVDMISKQLHTLLETKGLVRIKCLGEKFDPHKHDAIEVVEEDNGEADTVIDEMQPGYILNGRIIRPAKVKVLKVKESLQEAEDSGNNEINNEDNKDENIEREG